MSVASTVSPAAFPSTGGNVFSRHPPVIIEIGSILLKAGFVGEVHPRIITHSPPIVSAVLNNNYFRNGPVVTNESFSSSSSSTSSSSPGSQPSSSLPFRSSSTLTGYLPRYQRLIDELAVCFSSLFTRGLYIRPQDHTLLLIDNYLSFNPELRSILLYVFFHTLSIPYVKFISQPLSITLGLQQHSSLIIDIGKYSTRIIPVVLGQILHNNIRICNSSSTVRIQHWIGYVVGLHLAKVLYRRQQQQQENNLTSSPVGITDESVVLPTLSSNVQPRPGVTYPSTGYDYPLYHAITYTHEGLEVWKDTNSLFLRTYRSDIEGLLGRWIENIVTHYSQYLFLPVGDKTNNDAKTDIVLLVPSSIGRVLQFPVSNVTNNPNGTVNNNPEYSITLPRYIWSGIGELLWRSNNEIDVLLQQYEESILQDTQYSSVGNFLQQQQCCPSSSSSSPSFVHRSTFFTILQRMHSTVRNLLLSETVEEETQSVPHCIVNTLRKVPIDTRKLLASSLCITGGIINSNIDTYSTLLCREVCGLVTDDSYQGIDKVTGKIILKKSSVSSSLSPYGSVRPLLSYLTISNYHHKYTEPIHLSWFGASLLGYTLSITSRLVHTHTINTIPTSSSSSSTSHDFQRIDALTESCIERRKFLNETTSLSSINDGKRIDIPSQYNFALFSSGILAWDSLPTTVKEGKNTKETQKTTTNNHRNGKQSNKATTSRSTSVSSTSSIESLTRGTSLSSSSRNLPTADVRTMPMSAVPPKVPSETSTTASRTTTTVTTAKNTNAAKLELLANKLKTGISKTGSTANSGSSTVRTENSTLNKG